MIKTFDAIVIGAGQAGPSLAGRLTGAGMSVALIERKLIGGTCVNTGCTPTKTLIASAYAAQMARRASDYGLTIGGAVGVDMKKVKARKDAVSGNSRTGLETWLKRLPNCTVYEGHARFETLHDVRVGEELLSADRIFLNVGGRALVPDMAGLDQVNYLTNTSMLDLDVLPRHLVIVGGGYVALEFVQMYRRFGSEVTVVEKGPRLIQREDEEVSAAVQDIRYLSLVLRPKSLVWSRVMVPPLVSTRPCNRIRPFHGRQMAAVLHNLELRSGDSVRDRQGY